MARRPLILAFSLGGEGSVRYCVTGPSHHYFRWGFDDGIFRFYFRMSRAQGKSSPRSAERRSMPRRLYEKLLPRP